MPRDGVAPEGVDEGDVVGDAQLLEVVEDRKLGRRGRVDAPAQMVEIVAEQVVVGAAQEAVRPLAGLGAEPLDAHAAAALPGEAERVIERMQHREAEMHALDRQAGGGQPLAKAAHHRFQVVRRRARTASASRRRGRAGWRKRRPCDFSIIRPNAQLRRGLASAVPNLAKSERISVTVSSRWVPAHCGRRALRRLRRRARGGLRQRLRQRRRLSARRSC